MVMYKTEESELSQLLRKCAGISFRRKVPMTAEEILALIPEGAGHLTLTSGEHYVCGPNSPNKPKFSAEDAEKIYKLYRATVTP